MAETPGNRGFIDRLVSAHRRTFGPDHPVVFLAHLFSVVIVLASVTNLVSAVVGEIKTSAKIEVPTRVQHTSRCYGTSRFCREELRSAGRGLRQAVQKNDDGLQLRSHFEKYGGGGETSPQLSSSVP